MVDTFKFLKETRKNRMHIWISECVGFIVLKPEFCYIIVLYRDFLGLCNFRMFLKTLKMAILVCQKKKEKNTKVK